MAADLVAGPLGDLLREGTDPAIVDLGAPSAAGADDVMVMGRFADDVGVLSGGEIDPLHDTEREEELERTEDGRPPDPGAPLARVRHEVRRAEVPAPSIEQSGDDTPRFGETMPGGVERAERLFGHGLMILSLTRARQPVALNRPNGPPARADRPSAAISRAQYCRPRAPRRGAESARSVALERRDSEPGSPRERRRDRRIAARHAERERARTRPAPPAWRSPTALVTIGAVVIGILVLAVVVAFTGSTGGSTPASAASIIAPPTTIPAGLENDRTLGRADAPVTVDVWTDFQCPYCGAFTREIEPQLIHDFVVPGTVKLVAHDLSFIGAGHTPDESNDAAVAARCAARQGRFWEYDNYLFWNQLGENVGSFTPARLLAIASAVGLDTTTFTSCVADPSVLAAVTADTAAGTAKGVTSTPTLFVNGTKLVGVPSYESLAATIRAAAGTSSPANPNPSPSASPSVSSAP